MIVPKVGSGEEANLAIIREFVQSCDQLDVVSDDSILCYHLQRCRVRNTVEQIADTFYRRFNTKTERLKELTRLNMLVAEGETAETAPDGDVLGHSGSGRISTKGGLLLNSSMVMASLAEMSDRRAQKEAASARKAVFNEKRQRVVQRLKLYGYIAIDDDGNKLADPLRLFLRRNGMRGGEWKAVLSELVDRVYALFQDTTRVWQHAPPPPSASYTSAPASRSSLPAPTGPASVEPARSAGQSAAAPVPAALQLVAPDLTTTLAHLTPPNNAEPCSTPDLTLQKRKRASRSRQPQEATRLSAHSRWRLVEQQSAIQPNAPRSSRQRTRSTADQKN
jgi:hypothetical protein